MALGANGARHMTAEDLWRMPDGDRRHELDEGELIEMSPPGHEHGHLAVRIGGMLEEFARKRGLGVVAVETGFVLRRRPDVVRAPDVSFVRASRLVRGISKKFHSGAPDLAVEIASPSESPAQMVRKVNQYLRYGAHTVWVVDPDRQAVDVYRASCAPAIR